MRRTGWGELKKRLLALGVAAVMVENTMGLSVLPVLPVMAMVQEQTVDMEAAEEPEQDADSLLNHDNEEIAIVAGRTRMRMQAEV